MFEIFSTREIATLLYSILIAIFFLSQKVYRDLVVAMLRVAIRKRLATPFVILCFYSFTLIGGLCLLPFWEWIHLKTIFVWIFFAGIPYYFEAKKRPPEEHYFKKKISSNFKFFVLVEFLVGSFTFSLTFELILIPFIWLLNQLYECSHKNKEFELARKPFLYLQNLIIFLVLYFTAKKAYFDYVELDIVQSAVTLLIPLVFSLFYIPIAYLYALCHLYKRTFTAMYYKESDNRSLLKQRNLDVIRHCGLSYKKIFCFFGKYKEVFGNSSDFEFYQALYSEDC